MVRPLPKLSSPRIHPCAGPSPDPPDRPGRVSFRRSPAGLTVQNSGRPSHQRHEPTAISHWLGAPVGGYARGSSYPFPDFRLEPGLFDTFSPLFQLSEFQFSVFLFTASREKSV